MRKYIDILNESQRLPDKVLHGTTKSGWRSMQDGDAMIAHDPEVYLTFTTDWNTAFRFARDLARKFGEKGEGVILTLDGHKLAQDFHFEPYYDPKSIAPTQAWRINDTVIKPLSHYLVDVEDNSNRRTE